MPPQHNRNKHKSVFTTETDQIKLAVSEVRLFLQSLLHEILLYVMFSLSIQYLGNQSLL